VPLNVAEHNLEVDNRPRVVSNATAMRSRFDCLLSHVLSRTR
jgi:hypothetical protein